MPEVFEIVSTGRCKQSPDDRIQYPMLPYAVVKFRSDITILEFRISGVFWPCHILLNRDKSRLQRINSPLNANMSREEIRAGPLGEHGILLMLQHHNPNCSHGEDTLTGKQRTLHILQNS